MKKIMIIHHTGSLGGASVSILNTIHSLEKDYEIVIYCPKEPHDFSEYLLDNNINVKIYSTPIASIHYFSGGPRLYSPVFIENILNIKKYKKLWKEVIANENPDILLVNSKILSWFSIIANELRIKSICYVRETRKRSLVNFWNNIQRNFLDKFSLVIFISRYDEKIEKLKKAKSAFVPNFIDDNQYSIRVDRRVVAEKFKIPTMGFNILFVGGMLRIKGFNVAVKAMKYLKKYNVNLIVAGDSTFQYSKSSDIFSKIYNKLKKSYENNINRIIKIYNLDNIIHRIGTQKNMNEIYELADVLIFPANEPHQSRPAFEAGAKKVPIIMPDFENTNEFVTNGINGLIFKRKSSRDLAKCIERLINDQNLKNKLGKENYKSTINNHTREHSERLLLEAIHFMLADEEEI